MSFTPHHNRFSTGDLDDEQGGRASDRDGDVVARWIEQVEFESRLRSLASAMRPHKAQRLAGWREYRARGYGLRVTVAWDPAIHDPAADGDLAVPRMAEALETLLVGSAARQDDLHPHEEFALYAAVVRDLLARLTELRSRYD